MRMKRFFNEAENSFKT